MMTGQRAGAVLAGLETHQLSFTADEIEELLKLELAVEADPDDLAKIQWLVPAVRELAEASIDDPNAAQTIAIKLHETEEELKGDWYRMKTSKAKIAAREQERITMRRTLGVLSDKPTLERLAKIIHQGRELSPGAQYCACEALGSELYALTSKGVRVRRQLEPRLERYGTLPFKTFMQSFAKTEAKMQAFSGEIATLSQNIGYVKKNPHQVVIGLAKTGVPAAQALGAYQAALRQTRAPDIAVTCARNATDGSTEAAANRLRAATHALQSAGLPNTPVVMGLAKTLLPFEPVASGIPRLTELLQLLKQAFPHDELVYKLAGRLMPAAGTPTEVVQRALATLSLLNQMASEKVRDGDRRIPAVALASMVRDDAALPALVARFRAIEQELLRHRVSLPNSVEGDALECVACPGTPVEVAETVRALLAQLARGRDVQRADVAVAVAFAKRFAY